MSTPEHEPPLPAGAEPSVTAPGDEELLAALADEFATRLRRREHPTVEEYVAKHPALAERIRKVLAAVAMIEQTRPMDVLAAGEGAGSTIGRYKLLERIGDGGFGVVYMAEQLAPVRRRVALKVIKPGMDSRQVLARFEAERQALAIMDHPHIAKVFDGGMTDSGRPYFVMELVKGESITTYCDNHHLPPRARLELFVQVCGAVQHAHQKGIIHRDLKPSNVLVTQHDSTPVIKVIDFGVAKALGQELTEQTLFTGFTQLIGTPLYMSPEQAGQSSLDVDTRSDIYSLGVLLYELLTGTTPFDKERFKQAAQDEIRRIIREEEPPKPSTRLSQSTDSLASIAAQRHTEPAKLTKLLRGELDWIVMKALEKERARRYETANGLAMDVGRYLDDEAVLACPPSRAYRLKKFVRRNRATVTAATAVATALVLGVIGTSAGMARAYQQRRLADDSARLARAEAARAEQQAERAVAAEAQVTQRAREMEQVARFQAQMLGRINAADAGRQLMADIRRRFDEGLRMAGVAEPERAKRVAAFESELRLVNSTDTAKSFIDHTILKPAVAAAGEEFKDQPRVDASMRQTIADVYVGLGRFEEALVLQQQALATRREILGADHPVTIQALVGVVDLLLRLSRFAEAEPLCREAVEISRRALGEDHRHTLAALNDLGQVSKELGRMDDAERDMRAALDGRRRAFGERDADTLASVINLGTLLWDRGNLGEAEVLLREAAEKCPQALGADHEFTMNALGLLGALLVAQGKLAEAEPYHREALETRRRMLGEDHPNTLDSVGDMANLLLLQGKLVEAEPFCREGLERCRRVLGKDHVSTIQATLLLGGLLHGQQKFAEAEVQVRDALERQRRVFGENDKRTLGSLDMLASILWRQEKLADAEAYCREAYEKRSQSLGKTHPDTLTSAIGMGTLLAQQKKPAEAEPYFRAAVDGMQARLGKDHWRTAQARLGLGGVLESLGRYAEAESELLEAERIYSAVELVPAKRQTECIQSLVKLYTNWHAVEPNSGRNAAAAKWQAKLKEATTRPK